MAENEEELKSLLKVKDESEKPDFKLNIQKSKIMAILIPAFDSSSLVFHIMYSAYKLNKQGENILP